MRSRSPLRTSLSKRRGALAKHLAKALTGDSHAVHQARVASRRLRETLPIVGAGLDGAKAGKGAKKARRRMRRLTRALGPVRELEVTLGMIAPPPESESEAAAAPPAPSAAKTAKAVKAAKAVNAANAVKEGKKDPTALGREHVAAMLRRDLEKAREHLTSELDGTKVEDWLEQLEAIEDAIEPPAGVGDASRGSAAKTMNAAKATNAASASAGRTSARTRRVMPSTKWRAELADRLDARAANLKNAMDEAGVLFDSERLHQVRIALKRLRYAMELAGELRVTSTAAAVRDLKSVQDVLGTLHDHDVLMEYTASAAAQPGLARPTRTSLTALNSSLDRTRHELHAQFVAARSTLERIHLRALDAAVRARAKAPHP
jgi:CHAD domain-containing protein